MVSIIFWSMLETCIVYMQVRVSGARALKRDVPLALNEQIAHGEMSRILENFKCSKGVQGDYYRRIEKTILIMPAIIH